MLPPDRQFLPWRRGVKHAVRPLAAKAAGCCGIFLFLPPSCAVPILAEQAMSRVRWRTEQSEACPGRGPARITLRVLRRKKNAAATGSRVRLPGAGHRHGPRCHGWRSGEGARARHRCPAAHSPAVKDQSNNTGAQRPAGGVGARRHHTARQPTPVPPGPSVRLIPCTRSACDRCPPGETSGRPQRHASGGCHPAVAVRLARGAPPRACRGWQPGWW